MSAAALPRLSRPMRQRPLFAGLDRKAVACKRRESKWTGLPMMPDVWRLARSRAQAAFLWEVYFQTEGKPHDSKARHWHPPTATEPLFAEDVCKGANTFTRQHMADEIADACNANEWREALVEEVTPHRYRLRREMWGAMRSEPRKHEGVAIPRKAPKSDGLENDDFSAQALEDAGVNGNQAGEETENSRATTVARVVIEPGEETRVAPRTVCRNRRAEAIPVSATVTDGEVCIELLPPAEVVSMPTKMSAPSSESRPTVSHQDIERLEAALKELPAAKEFRLLPIPDDTLRSAENARGDAPREHAIAFLGRELDDKRRRGRPYNKLWLPQTFRKAAEEWAKLSDEEKATGAVSGWQFAAEDPALKWMRKQAEKRRRKACAESSKPK